MFHLHWLVEQILIHTHFVNMYWPAPETCVVFYKTFSAWKDSFMDVQTRWLWMLYGCRNQEHMLFWLWPEDRVRLLCRMYAFSFSRRQLPNCKLLSGDPSKCNWLQRYTQRMTQKSIMFCYINVLEMMLYSYKNALHILSCGKNIFFARMSSLCILPWGDEPLTFSSKW